MPTLTGPDDTNLFAAPAYEPGRYWVSPLNFDPEVRETYAFPEPLVLHDNTLRKILYTAGVRPSLKNLLRIVDALEQIGITEQALNLDYWGDGTPDRAEWEVVKAVLARKSPLKTTVGADIVLTNPVWGIDFDFEAAARLIDDLQELGLETFGIGVRDPRSEDGRNRQIDHLERVIEHLKARQLRFCVDVSDVGRTNFEHLVRVGKLAVERGAARFHVADSANTLAPEAMKVFIRRVRARLENPIPLVVHVHDDFGLATAVAIAAATAGARPELSVNGVSYRAGFAALEEVAVALEVQYGVKTGIDLSRLQGLSELVAEATGFPVPPLKPIVGAHAFLREIPHMMMPYVRAGKGSDVFPPAGTAITAGLVGSGVRLAWGGHRSHLLIEEKLRHLDLASSPEVTAAIFDRVDAELGEYNAYPSLVLESRLEEICKEVAGPVPE